MTGFLEKREIRPTRKPGSDLVVKLSRDKKTGSPESDIVVENYGTPLFCQSAFVSQQTVNPEPDIGQR